MKRKKEKNLFEDFTTLRWVKWTKRKPKWEGSVYVKWNDKWHSHALVIRGCIIKLGDNAVKSKIVRGKRKYFYTKEQKDIIKNVYWLEELQDIDGFDKYLKKAH